MVNVGGECGCGGQVVEGGESMWTVMVNVDGGWSMWRVGGECGWWICGGGCVVGSDGECGW